VVNPIANDKNLTNVRQNIGTSRQHSGADNANPAVGAPSTGTAGSINLTTLSPMPDEPLPPRGGVPLGSPTEARSVATALGNLITQNQQQAAQAFGAISSGIAEATLS